MKNEKPSKQIGVGDIQINPLGKRYIKEIISTNRVTYGKFGRQFEKAFAKVHGVQYATFCNSGTSALHIAITLLKKKFNWLDQDEIIVPALTFPSTINVVIHNNLKPVFVDVEENFFSLDPTKIETAITSHTRAIIPVHIGGHPAQIDEIVKIAKKHKLKIIEDASETFFAKYKGKSIGSFSDISCFSTYAAHTLPTGVGGFICTNNKILAEQIKSLVNHGRDNNYLAIDDDSGKTGTRLAKIINSRFRFNNIGYSFRPTEFEAALGLSQIKSWKTIVSTRQKHVEYLTSGLSDLSDYLSLPEKRPNATYPMMFYTIILKDKRIKRSDLVFFLEKNLIETRFLFPLFDLKIYKGFFKNPKEQFPVSYFLSNNGFYIGCHPGLEKKDLDWIIQKFHNYFTRLKLEKID